MWRHTDQPVDGELLRVIRITEVNKQDALSDPGATVQDLLQTELEEIEDLNLESTQESLDRLIGVGLLEEIDSYPKRYICTEEAIDLL
jgi:hypothetical protein